MSLPRKRPESSHSTSDSRTQSSEGLPDLSWDDWSPTTNAPRTDRRVGAPAHSSTDDSSGRLAPSTSTRRSPHTIRSTTSDPRRPIGPDDSERTVIIRRVDQESTHDERRRTKSDATGIQGVPGTAPRRQRVDAKNAGGDPRDTGGRQADAMDMGSPKERYPGYSGRGYPKGLPEGRGPVVRRLNTRTRKMVSFEGIPWERLPSSYQRDLDEHPYDDAGQLRVFIRGTSGTWPLIEYGSDDHAKKLREDLRSRESMLNDPGVDISYVGRPPIDPHATEDRTFTPSTK